MSALVRLASRLCHAPSQFFAGVALLVGAALCFLIPPLGGGNETFNFTRAVQIAYGQFSLGDVNVPEGFVRFIEEGGEAFPEGAQPPYAFSLAMHGKLADITLGEEKALLKANLISILHPISYLPQAAIIRLGAELGISPFKLFYFARLAGLFCAVWMTAIAIRLMPSQQLSLAALALLPTILFTRSTLDADQLNNALAFLCVAMVLNFIAGEGELKRPSLGLLALITFATAQSKSAYMLLPLLCFAIPAARFHCRHYRRLWLFILIIPGIAAGLGWMLLLKFTFFTGEGYSTWGGDANPDAQLRYVLTHPIAYAITFFKTLLHPEFFALSITGILGTFGPPVRLSGAWMGALALLLACVLIGDKAEQHYSKRVKAFAALIFSATLGVLLSLLYLHWTGVSAPKIEGYQGRYLYPILPLLLVLLAPSGHPYARPAALMLAAASAAATLYTTWDVYLR